MFAWVAQPRSAKSRMWKKLFSVAASRLGLNRFRTTYLITPDERLLLARAQG